MSSKVMQPGEQKSGMDSMMGMLQMYNQGASAYNSIKGANAKKTPEDEQEEKRGAMKRRGALIGG